MAAMPTGMLIQKTPRQPTETTSAPPMTGPTASDRPNTEPHRPIAFARSAGVGVRPVARRPGIGISVINIPVGIAAIA